jgi:hypothetical protein
MGLSLLNAYSYLHTKMCCIMNHNIQQIYITCTMVHKCTQCPYQVFLWSWYINTNNDVSYLPITVALNSTQISFNCDSMLHGTHESPSHRHNSFFFYNFLNWKHRLLTFSRKTLHWSIFTLKFHNISWFYNCTKHIKYHIFYSTNRTYNHSNLQMQGINFTQI